MSAPSFAALVRFYRSIQRVFDRSAIERKQSLLQQLSTMPFGSVTAVTAYHEALLYSVAYPESTYIYEIANTELNRIANYVFTAKRSVKSRFDSTGIAGSNVSVPLSLSLNTWLVENYADASWITFEDANESLIVQTLGHLLDPVEQEMMHEGKTEWPYWRDCITGTDGQKTRLMKWLVTMSGSLPGSTAVRESTFGQFGINTIWSTTPDAPLLTLGRAKHVAPYIHVNGLERNVVLAQWMKKKPLQERITNQQKSNLVDLARGVLTSLRRETDTVTHANIHETEFYNMGRGLGIALYYMKPDMKMSVQSYVGFFVFKNQIPCAYGGGWILHNESFFGINILPAFRGGESAYIVSEILRLYRHAFRIKAFCVDPYQLGYGNTDGIASRSFWFYYRLGFRPLEPALARIAKTEYAKIVKDGSYQSSRATLVQLSEATMRWKVDASATSAPITADRLGNLVTEFVNHEYDGDRRLAIRAALAMFNRRTSKAYTIHHPIAHLVVLLMASGYLKRANANRLRTIADDYALKYQNEHEYIKLSQKHTALFSSLRQS